MEQRQRLYKARIALALYAKYGRVPKAAEITRAYNQFRARHVAMLTTRLQIKASKRYQQLALF